MGSSCPGPAAAPVHEGPEDPRQVRGLAAGGLAGRYAPLCASLFEEVLPPFGC